MIKSMTGFGRSVLTLQSKKITVEIKSLNSKQTDLSSRIPSYYREKELELRKYVTSRLVRGKIDISIYVETEASDANHTINQNIVRSYISQLENIGTNATQSELLTIAVRFPDVFKTEREELDQDEWTAVMSAVEQAVDAIDAYRSHEGEQLSAELKSYIKNITDLLTQVDRYESGRIEQIKARLLKNLDELSVKVDQNRFEQEIIFYLEKLDVTEEKVRLALNLDHFLSTMNDEQDCGKKLGFITQEIGREINTLGSKSNHADMQKLVVQMKDELEKIKEQSLNIL